MNPLYIALLQEVAKTPEGFLTPAVTLRNAVRFVVLPQPSYAEIDTAIDRLEELKYITLVTNELKGKRYSITDAGRAALAS